MKASQLGVLLAVGCAGGPVPALAGGPEAGFGAGSGAGHRSAVTAEGGHELPLVVVSGTPREMGLQVGRLLRDEIRAFIPGVVEGFMGELGLGEEGLDRVWAATAAFTDDRVEQELVGVAEGAGVPVRLLQHAHCLPLLMPYSCSSVAAWGEATADGHLYQTRNLDWSLEAGAHEFAALVVYLPSGGNAHVLPTFAGFVGANCGLSAAGIALSEMGDSPSSESPYEIHAPHFTTWFRTVLYDAGSLDEAMAIFGGVPHTKRYHFVFGDGSPVGSAAALKIRAHSPEEPPVDVVVWRDNDPEDELAPAVLPGVVYQDEGRGAFPLIQESYGKIDGPGLIQIANAIPIKGGNVLNAVFDATALRLWVSYAQGDDEAYQRPYFFLDLAALDADRDGTPDLEQHRERAAARGPAGITSR